jgi:hypothetical protein
LQRAVGGLDIQQLQRLAIDQRIKLAESRIENLPESIESVKLMNELRRLQAEILRRKLGEFGEEVPPGEPLGAEPLASTTEASPAPFEEAGEPSLGENAAPAEIWDYILKLKKAMREGYPEIRGEMQL